VDCQGGAAEFNEIVIAEGIDDSRQVSAKQVFQLGVSDIAGRHEQELFRAAGYEMGLNEIVILGDDHPALIRSQIKYLCVWRTVTQREIQRVQGIVTGVAQQTAESSRQLRVDQEPHAAMRSMRFTCASRAA
jgi:hypothetical protein